MTPFTTTARPSQARPSRLAAACATALAFALAPWAAQAASLVIDDFTAPTAPVSSVLNGIGERTLWDTPAGVVGGARDVYHHTYRNLLNSVTATSVGNGVLSSTDGLGATSEVLVLWGAFTRPGGNPTVGGPRMRLDTRAYDAFEMAFTGIKQAMNINVVLYTSAPLDPRNPLYYTTVGVNVAPASPGGPLTVVLPMSRDPNFNYAQVDGIALVLNRAIGNITNNAFNLDSFALSDAGRTVLPAR